jgi:phage tail-like protein
MDAARIVRLLPEVYQAAARPGSVLAALLAAMERQHAPAEAALETLDAVFDPRRATEPFLRMMAGWVGLESLVQASGAIGQDRLMVEEEALRELVARAAELARLRGTADALRVLLELATGVPGFEVGPAPPDAEGRTPAFAAVVSAPADARPLQRLVETVVAEHKPAFTTVAIAFRTD